MLSAILYVLRTGIQWNALPRELGACTTVYDRFRLWEQQGMFERIWQAGLQEYDELEGIAWEWQSMDGVMTKAPFGGAATGANPTDRGKRGTKRSQLSDGRGMPLAVVIDGANRTDMKLAEATLDSIMIARPTPTAEQPQHLCLDAGYDYDAVFETVRAHHYEPHIRPNQYNRAHAKPTPERARRPAAIWSPPNSLVAGSWNACIPGSIARDACWCAGRSLTLPMKPSCIGGSPCRPLSHCGWRVHDRFDTRPQWRMAHGIEEYHLLAVPRAALLSKELFPRHGKTS